MNNDDITTKPTLETVLERVNSFGEQLINQLTELRSEVAELRTGQIDLRSDVAELRAGQVEMRNDIADLNVGQRKLVHKMTALNDNMLALQAELQADSRAVDRRLEKLESRLPR